MSDNNSALTPYAQSLGIAIHGDEDGTPVLTVDFSAQIEGRPGAFHGGATSGLLETAGYAVLRKTLDREGRNPQLKPINITVQFLSTGKQKTTYAKGRITRLGRRNANVSVEAWQDDRDRPIATAIMNILMADREG
ncbi:PaaI family thioesterase [Altererythrobacter arenosus]|uniref:PaaI family thioesterase n=1 Tax=Altererythrobacter arenosus TaxID=3032592 RepID=A0ABY8FRG9_9SPHN|nr:PaaI family thioesterase [Altererythrobacter sp. CAU 1644]WFL77606.1 PaaI family thioesterase [Altererythrobacter sp. CAU 1644]